MADVTVSESLHAPIAQIDLELHLVYKRKVVKTGRSSIFWRSKSFDLASNRSAVNCDNMERYDGTWTMTSRSRRDVASYENLRYFRREKEGFETYSGSGGNPPFLRAGRPRASSRYTVPDLGFVLVRLPRIRIITEPSV